MACSGGGNSRGGKCGLYETLADELLVIFCIQGLLFSGLQVEVV